MSNEVFTHDVFLSHSSKDKAVVSPLAERLQNDGLKVWFDEWEIKPGDHIQAKIEEGLEHSRVLLFCMSANAFGSDWAQLESGTFRFRDPLNKERRFIPLRLDDTHIKGSLAQFSCINWHSEEREHEYAKLREACRFPKKELSLEEKAARERLEVRIRSLGHTDSVSSIAWSPDGQRALSGSADNTVRLWEVATGRCERVLEGHSASVRIVAWSRDGQRVLSAALNGVMRVWETGVGGRDETISPSERVATVAAVADQVQYTNAKVLLVGERRAGKTGLSKRLALNRNFH